MLQMLKKSNRSGAKALRTGNRSGRQTRRVLQMLALEMLERRDVPAVLVETGDAPPLPLSDSDQASCTSASFEQASMSITGFPTSTPGVSSGTPAREPIEETPRTTLASTMMLTEAMRIDTSSSAPTSPFKLLPAVPNLRDGAGGMIRGLRDNSKWPAEIYVPYVDLSIWPPFDLVEAATSQGIRYFNLAFITADSQNQPSWAGYDRYAVNGNSFDLLLRQQIDSLRAIGGDVAVSFGGPKGIELATSIHDVEQLRDAYRTVVDAYGLKRIDFDLEGPALRDADAIERRSRALAALQAERTEEGRTLEIWFTLPANSAGLTLEGLEVVSSAQRHGIELGGVNLKLSNYEPQSSTGAQGKSGLQAIQSSINAFYQMHRVLAPPHDAAQIWHKLGVTPSIGRGTTAGGAFYPDDAQRLSDFACEQHLGMVGIWSINRDQQSKGSNPSSAADSSGIKQDAFEFSNIFMHPGAAAH